MMKTGGTWLTHYLVHEYGGKQAGRAHTRYPGGLGLNFGSIRDPWSWYASWYCHAVASSRMAYMKSFGGGSPGWPNCLLGALRPRQQNTPSQLFVLTDTPKRARVDWLNFKGGGLWSFMVRWAFGSGPMPLIDMHSLYTGVEALLERPIDRGKYKPLGTRKIRSNSGGRRLKVRTTSDMYTPDLIEKVWEADRDLAEQLGYREFNMPSEQGPLVHYESE